MAERIAERIAGWAGHRAVRAASVALLLVVLHLLLTAPPAYAVAYIVNSTADTVGGSCTATCTLRNALALAHDGDTIRFNLPNPSTILLGSTLTVSTDVAIVGPGAAQLAVDGQNSVTVFVVNSDVSASMSNLTIQHGQASNGGGIVNNGTLALSNITIAGNGTLKGGGLANLGSATVTNATFVDNGAIDSGGAIYNPGTLSISASAFGGNGATAAGGAIHSTGTLTMTGSSVTGNRTGSSGAGLYVAGNATVTGSTIADNLDSGDFGGGIHASNATLALSNSTISGNSAKTGGGGLYSSASAVTVTNSTISGNSVTLGFGGGLYVVGASGDPGTTVVFTTLSSNSALSGANIMRGLPLLSLRNSIVVAGRQGPDCQTSSGPVTSLGNNLTDSDTCFPGGTNGDILTTTPKLGPLALHAPGVTKTHALLPGSPAIDGVTYQASTDCGGSGTGHVTTDQRGVLRPQFGGASRCDIGAFEVSNSAPLIGPIGPQSTDEDTPSQPISFTVGDQYTAAEDLVVTARTSNQTIVPDEKVVVTGSGADRSATITPLANQYGTVDVTLTVSNGYQSASRTFALTVAPVNDAPVNTVPGAQTTAQGTPLVFSAGNSNRISVADVDAGANPIQVALTATNGTVTLNGTNGLALTGTNGSSAFSFTGSVDQTNIALNGLTFTPSSQYSGPASLKIATSDQGNTGSGGPLSATDTVAITVQPFHAAPTISSIADQRVGPDGSTPTVPFTVGSTEVAAGSLVVTATSSNAALVPPSGIMLSGTGTARAIRVTPAPRQSGEATVTVTVGDGTAQAQASFKVTVVAAVSTAPSAPSAAPDSYSVAATQTLAVAADAGVLKNDGGAGANALQAQVVLGPGHGSLDLQPDGGFTYRPDASFAGTDTFSYRASDGGTASSPATVTITVTPARCAPRATVKVSTAAVGGKLQVTIEALPLAGQSSYRLIELRFGAFQNGTVSIGGQSIASGTTYTVPTPANTQGVTLTVSRVTAGQATTIPLTVVDECGPWPTFVGGGPNAW